MRTAAEFRATWSQHDVRLPAAGLHRDLHPLVGDLELVFEAGALLATAEVGVADRIGAADSHR